MKLERWWGRFALAEGQEGRWRVGGVELVIQRQRGEWRVGLAHHTGVEDDHREVEVPRPATELGATLAVTRYGVSRATDDLELLPIMPDRPLVVRPETRLRIPGGEEIALHLSLPVFVRIGVGQPARTLEEVSTLRLPDTWFGPSTVSGELGYSLRTQGRLDLEGLVRKPHRAITALRIRNQARTPLELVRVAIPVESLQLYARPDGALWTDALTLERDEDEERVAVKVDARGGVPEDAANVSGPRVVARSVLVRAFGSMFSR